MLSEISSATCEQSAGIAQVERAVNQLDQVTQQNVALAELGAGASDTLKGLAASLDQSFGAFHVATL